MSYDSDVMARARERYQAAVDRHRTQQGRLREELYGKFPEIQEIDGRLRENIAHAAVTAFQTGGDPEKTIASARTENQKLQARRAEILRRGGISPEAYQEGPLCARCGDTGWIGTQMCSCLQGYCEEEQRKELTSLLEDGRSFDDFRLDYYPETVDPETGMSPRGQMDLVYELAVRYARNFSPDSGKNLLMSGAPGLGKTFLSACIAREVVAAGYSVCYDTAIHLFGALEKQKFGGAGEEDEKTAARIQSADLLIFDDLGTEMPTAFITPALYTVINGRILSRKPTIISTNLNIRDIEKRYSPQIVSRIAGEYTILSFAGRDIRRQKTGQ